MWKHRVSGAFGCATLLALSPGDARGQSKRAAPVAAESVAERPRWMIVAGGALLGATYITSFGIAAAAQGCGNAFLGMDCVQTRQDSPTDWPLFIPVFGPFIALGSDSERPAYLLALLGLGQVLGVAAVTTGLVLLKPGIPSTLTLAPAVSREALTLKVGVSF